MLRENGFSYHYSAEQQAADTALRRRYHLPDSMELTEVIRQSPQKEKNSAVMQAIGLGVASVLIFGCGLSLVLTQSGLTAMICGIVFGAAGIGGMAAMPTIYERLLESKRKRTEQRLHQNT